MKKKATNSTALQGEVRIIAGVWRGRKLPVLNAQGLRPTGDRVKETLFNWLMYDIVDACCLDCFAGSGALGFEALSRQAKKVVFLELDKKVAQQLDKNLLSLKCDKNKGQVIAQNSLAYLSQAPAQPMFDIVFIDPPFHFNLAQQAVDLLAQHHWLKAGALVYVETEKGVDLTVPPQWQLTKEKSTGQVAYRLYRVA